jgi:divalent metal cation (Fe/Co/Zn/Cd) transporter
MQTLSRASHVPADMTLADAHELASRIEDDIRDGQPHMQDVVVHTEPSVNVGGHGPADGTCR